MKKLTTLFSAALCTVALCGAENLVKNGDFSGETLAPWTSPQRMKKVIHSLEDGKLVVTGDSQNKYNRELNCVQNLPALEVGKAYLLSGKAISKAAPQQGKSCRVNIRAINSKGGSIGYYGFVIDLSKKDLTEYNFVYIPKAGAVNHQLYIKSNNLGDDEQVIIDDLALTEVKKFEDDPNNLVKDGSFEDPVLFSWKTPQTGNDRHFFGISKDAASGNFSLRASGDTAFKYNNFLTIQQALPKVKKGQSYVLSAKYLCNIAVPGRKVVRIQIREVAPNGSTVKYSGGAINLHKSDFADYSYTFTPSDKAASWTLYISTTGLEREDSVIIDDVKLLPLAN